MVSYAARMGRGANRFFFASLKEAELFINRYPLRAYKMSLNQRAPFFPMILAREEKRRKKKNDDDLSE